MPSGFGFRVSGFGFGLPSPSHNENCCPDTAAWGGTNNALDSYPSLIIAPTTLLLPEWSRQQAADEPLAAITPAKARLTDKLAALDHLPAALLRGAFAGNI